MKEQTILKLIELGKKDKNVNSLILSFLQTENNFPNHNIEEEDINKILILVLEREKQTPEIKQAIELLKKDTKVDIKKETKKDEYIEITLFVNVKGKSSKIVKKLSLNQYNDMNYPEQMINQICNEFKTHIVSIVNNNK